MRVEALGVSGAPAPNRLTTCFLVGDNLLIDAGGAAHALPPERWPQIRHILLTHSHLDHVLGLPFLLTAGGRPTVYGLQATLDAVTESLFDGRIWPDLTAYAQWHPLEAGAVLDIDGLSIEVGPATHTVPCLSYALGRASTALTIVGDTRLDDDVLAWAGGLRPGACIVECSFPAGSHATATAFGHQSTRDIPSWREALGPDCAILLTHVKPGHEDAIRGECEALGDGKLRILHDGDEIDF